MSFSDDRSGACEPQTLTAADGAQLSACAHGGHVLGWTPAGGRPRLWVSPTAECGPGLAIRGGVPVIFPQFAGRGPLPKHGVARNRAWQVLPTPPIEPGDGARWSARLVDDEATRAAWPQRFELTLTARAGGDTLEVELAVANPGDSAWAFTAALHTYLALGDPGSTVSGIGGRTAQDNADGMRPVRLGEAGRPLAATDARDVAVLSATDPLTLDDPELGPLTLTATGFTDRVIWNPGPGHGLADVPEGAEKGFVCIEPAVLTAVELEPGGSWRGTQTLRSVSVTFS